MSPSRGQSTKARVNGKQSPAKERQRRSEDESHAPIPENESHSPRVRKEDNQTMQENQGELSGELTYSKHKARNLVDFEGEVIDLPSDLSRQRSASPALSDSRDSWVTVEGEEFEEILGPMQEQGEGIECTADIKGEATESKSEDNGQCSLLENNVPSKLLFTV